MESTTNIEFSPQQKATITAFVKAHLAETANQPLAVPQKETPLIEKAKALGFRHAEALAITNQVIARMQKRADNEQARLDKAEKARVAYSNKLGAALKAMNESQPDYMQATPDTELVAYLVANGLKTTRSEVKRARRWLLRKQLATAFAQLYRRCVNGSVSLVLGKAAGVTQSGYTDWDLYRGAYKGWAAQIVDTTLTIRPDYWQRVTQQGITVVDGMLVLDAVPARIKNASCQVFRASWVKQGRGNAVDAVRGYVAKAGEETATGDTPEEAIARVTRRVKKAA